MHAAEAGCCPEMPPLRDIGGCPNYGPFLGTLNIRGRIIIGTQKGAIILTTTHILWPLVPLCSVYDVRFVSRLIGLCGICKTRGLNLLNPSLWKLTCSPSESNRSSKYVYRGNIGGERGNYYRTIGYVSGS